MAEPTQDELRKKILEEFAAAHAAQLGEQDDEEQEEVIPSVTTEAEVEAIEDEPAEVVAPKTKRPVYTRTLDLGDGSAPQVFKAATKDELLEKICNAQIAASKRINELKRQVKEGGIKPEKAVEAKKYDKRTLTADEEFDLSQEFQTNPSAALAKAMKAVSGVDPDDLAELAQESRERRQAAKVQKTGFDFLEAHPEYPQSTANEKAMAEYLKTNGLAWSIKNLELAFEELADDGLLSAAESKAIAAPAREVTRRRKATLGISAHDSVATDEEQDVPQELSAEAMSRLPKEERERIVRQSFRRR